MWRDSGGRLPVFLAVLQVVMMATQVATQTLPPTMMNVTNPPGSTTTTTTGPVSALPPIVIMNCPTEGVVAYTPRETDTVSVYWSVPYDRDFLIQPVAQYSPGSQFGVGVTEVVYLFTNAAGDSAQCVFNVTVLLQCAEPTDIPCGNGVCVPSSYYCDGYNDCADSPSGSDEQCPINRDCTSAAPMLYPMCADLSDWINATNAMATQGLATEFRFSAPADATDTTRLFEVRVNRTLIDLGRNELFSATLFITISLPDSSQTATVPFYMMNAEQISNSFLEVNLRNPLIVQPNEQIRISVAYDDNILTDRPPFLVGGNCSECVGLRYGTLRPGCQDGICLDAFYAFRDTLLLASLNSPGVPCGIAEQNELITSLYETCIGQPEFSFVSPSQASFPGDQVVLKCIAGGQVLPLVEWHDENMEVQASGVGYAVLEVVVSERQQSFVCTLDELVAYDETVTVSPWAADCDPLRSELAFYAFSSCLTTDVFFGSTLSQNPNRPVSEFPPPSSPVVAYRYSLDASLINPDSGEGFFEGSDGPPNQPATSLLLPMRLEMTLAVPRRRRNINQAELYIKEYDSVYVPVYGKVTFDLDPPVLIDIFQQVEVTVVVLESRPSIFVERPPPPPSTLDVVLCTQNNDSACVGFLNAWSEAQVVFVEAGCSEKRNLSLPAYQICQGVSTAEPIIITPPESVDITQMPVGDGVLEGRATLTCNIENAVEYNWYKVAPLPGRQFIKTGSTLSIVATQQSGLTDQGSYICVGKGGSPYESIELETEPAFVTIQGFSVFRLTGRLLNRAFTQNLTNPESQDYIRLMNDVRTYIIEIAEIRSPVDVEGITFSAGSVIVDAILYVGDTGMQDSETASSFASLFETILQAVIQFSPDSVVLESLVNCIADQSSGVDGNLTFPQTRIGQTAESVERCPPSTARAGMARATRECIGNMSMPATWMSAVTLPCSDQDVNSLLENLAKVEVTLDNVEAVARETAKFTSNHTEVNATGIIAIADILWNIVDARSPSSEVAVVVVEIVNNVLQVEEEEFDDLGNDNSPSRIVLALEAYITALQLGGAAGNLTVEESDVALAAVILPRDSLGQGLGFAALPEVSEQEPSQTDESRINVYYNPRTLPVADVEASITLPSAVLAFVTSGDQVPISFFFYANSKLFRSPSLRAAARPDDKFRRAVSSSIIAATVEGVRVENLPMDSPIVSAFLPLDVGGPEDTVNNSQCVFWNFTLNDGFGDWSGEGCRQELVNNSRTICHCDHLTSFAVIVDIYGNQDSVFLSIISKIGCGVSVVALIITIVTYLAVKKLRSKRPQQILISLCFALLGLYLVFLIGIEATESGAGCTIVAVLIHYFTLASLAWMAVEAANMYLLFVKILNANVSHFLIKASIVGWGLPLVVVVVILAVDHTNYMDESTTYCFLRPDYAFYFGQVLPIALVLLFNAIVFTLVMRQLTCARKGISSSMERSKRQEMVRRLTNAICITVLLGLTWVFGLLSLIQVANFVFQVFFCIFNSLQGLMIFILFCARQTEVQQAWLGWLQCCRKGRSDDYSAGTATRSRNQQDSQALGTLPLTANSTNTTNTT